MERDKGPGIPRQLNPKYYNKGKSDMLKASQTAESTVKTVGAIGLGILAFKGAARSGLLNRSINAAFGSSLHNEETLASKFLHDRGMVGAGIDEIRRSGVRSASLWDNLKGINIPEASARKIQSSALGMEGFKKNRNPVIDDRFIDRVIKNAGDIDRGGLDNNAFREQLKGAFGQAIRTTDSFSDKAIDNAKKQLTDYYKSKKLSESNVGDKLLGKAMGSMGYSRLTVNDAIQKNILSQTERAKLAQAVREDSSLGNHLVDKSIFIDKSGKAVDLRKPAARITKYFDYISDSMQIPFVGINPLNIAQYPYLRAQAARRPINFISAGELNHAGIEATAGPLKGSYYTVGNSLYDLNGNLIKDGVYVAASGPAIINRNMSKIMGNTINTKEFKNKKVQKISKIFDLGRQDEVSDFEEFTSFFTKFRDPTWEKNIYKQVRAQSRYQNIGKDKTVDEIYESYQKLSSLISDNTQILTGEDFNKIAYKFNDPNLLKNIGMDVDFTNTDSVINAFQKIYSPHGNSIYQGRFEAFMADYRKTGSSFAYKERVKSNNKVVFTDNVTVDQVYEMQDLLTKEAVYRLRKKGYDLGSVADTNVQNYNLMVGMDEVGRPLGHWTPENVTSVVDDFFKFFRENDQVLNDRVNKYSGTLSRFKKYDEYKGHGTADKLPSGQRVIVINGTNILSAVNDAIMEKGFTAEGIKDALHGAADGFKKAGVGLTAGRHNKENINAATVFAEFMFERNNRMLSKFGVGLGRDSLGSPIDAAKAMLLKRWLPVVGAYGAWQYFNDESDNLTGTNLEEAGAEVLRGENLAVTTFRDITGMTKAAKQRRELYAGWEMAVEDAPGFMQLHALGITGAMNTQELNDYLTEGQVAVRRGRWWGIGSSTPWRGDKIERFEDTWYQKAHEKDAKKVQLYGSETNYWAHSWIPNPRNPLGPLNQLIIDPYYLDREHYYDRPYLQTGPVQFLEDIPVIGPGLSQTVGNIFKPPIAMHTGTLQKMMLENINDKIKGNGLSDGSGAYGQLVGGGEEGYAPQLYTYETAVAKNIQLGYGISNGQVVESGKGTVKYQKTTPEQANAKAVRTAQLRSINNDIKSAGSTSVAGTYDEDAANFGVDTEFMPIGRAFSVPSLEQNWEDIMTEADPRFAYGTTFYQATDAAGIYGFVAGDIVGGNDKIFNGPVMQRGMYESLNKSFWDWNLGGLGGDFSEISRRFVTRPRRVNYFNPIKNTQPEWMPGDDYFMNFQEGDPYQKITKGEGRLPGAGYEANNELHPDEFGEYGAFDRFKILADVAPWSQEYMYWSKYVTHNITDEDLRKQIADIKKQVTASKKKVEFFEYRFKGVDIKKETVHVSRVLDANTFMTEEYPNNPVRLAGVRVNKANENRVYRDIKAGATLTIGYDPSAQIQNDTLGTIRAAVWDGSSNLNLKYINQGVGKERDTDYTPAGVYARFTPWERAKGAAWESIAHLNTPINNKFLPVMSAVERYERKEVYGENWQSWENPITGWLIPTVRNVAVMNPIGATVTGATLGALFAANGHMDMKSLWQATKLNGIKAKATGILSTMNNSGARGKFALFGAAVGLGSSIAYNMHSLITGEKWIPSDSKKKRNIDEYFDKIRYIKAERLFEQARKTAILEEGTDPLEIIEERIKKSEDNKLVRDDTKKKKRDMLINGAPDEDVKTFNLQLNELRDNKTYKDIGPYTMLALKYHQDAAATVYGSEEGGAWADVYRSLPMSDRPYFTEFMKAKTKKEQDKILKLVPAYQRHLFESKFGRKVHKQQQLDDYFTSHYLPDENWAGWLPDVNLDDIKYKVVDKEGLEATEFGLWDDVGKRADILSVKAPAINNSNHSVPIVNHMQVKAALHDIMKGYNLENVIIDVTSLPNKVGIDIDVDIQDNYLEQFRQKINEDPSIVM